MLRNPAIEVYTPRLSELLIHVARFQNGKARLVDALLDLYLYRARIDRNMGVCNNLSRILHRQNPGITWKEANALSYEAVEVYCGTCSPIAEYGTTPDLWKGEQRDARDSLMRGMLSTLGCSVSSLA